MIANNANAAPDLQSADCREELWVRVPITRVELAIQLPPGRHYYRRAQLRMDEFLEIALSTPGAHIGVFEKAARDPLPSHSTGCEGEKRTVTRIMQVVEKVPNNAAVLIYAPTDDCRE
jgi:hypothetical protein